MDNYYQYYDTISSDHSNIAMEFTSRSYTESDLETFDKIFIQIIEPELNNLIDIQDKYKAIGNKFTVNKCLEEFFEKIYTLSCPRILKHHLDIQQVYLLHILAVMLIRYNDRSLKMAEEKFINQVLVPNLMTSCAKYLVNARRFIHRLIRDAYLIVQEKSQDTISFYSDLHNVDPSSIKNDIIYLFLRNVSIQVDPLNLNNVEELYSSVIDRMFFFYLKAKTMGMKEHSFDQPFITELPTNDYPSHRYHIYEEALYLSQVKLMCDGSTSMHQVSKQYDRLKSMIIPNEVQKLYLFSLNKGFYVTDKQKLAIMKAQDTNDQMEYLKNNLPTIYRLLRSIHVISDTSTFIESEIETIRYTIYSTLYNRFKLVLNDEIIVPILKKITENLVQSLTTGEFIDIFTLTSISVTGSKFNEQLQKFLEMILSDIGFSEVPPT